MTTTGHSPDVPADEPIDWFGPGVAEGYDDPDDPRWSARVLDPTVDLLAELAGDGGALELAIGTGRVALPLSTRGVQVHGVDLSDAMLARLAAKPGSGRITAHRADMTSARLDREFAVVYLVFNTIMNVTSQDGQVEVFRTAAAHLRPGGHFVLEVGVPDLQRLPRGERHRPFTVTDRHLGIDEYDVLHQGLVSHHYADRGHGMTLRSIPFRYVWPSELDLMARLSGMTLVDRWADFDRTPFTATSDQHVSVWQLTE